MRIPSLPPILPSGRAVAAGSFGPGHPLWEYLFDPWGTIRIWLQTLLGGLAAASPLGWALLALAGLAAVAAGARLARVRRQRLASGARWVAILPPPQVDPAAAEGLWANLAGLLRARRRLLAGQAHVAFEYCWSVEGLSIGVWVPGTVAPGLVEQAIEAACPGARAEPAELPPPHPVPPVGDGVVLAGGLRLAGGDWLGLRTDHHADPLRALLGAAGELEAAETATVQILARPATRARRLRGLARASARVLAPGPSGGRPAHRLLDLLTPGVGSRVPSLRELTRGLDARAIIARLTEPAWEVSLRYAVASEAGADRRLRARAHALVAAYALYAGRNQLTPTRLRHPEHLATRHFDGGNLLSAAELGALAHLPLDVAVPGLARAGARPVAPPPAAPSAGKILGDAETGGRRPVALTAADACYHVHLLGATGSGKSTLITNLALDDIHHGRGVFVIDPKGDLATDILDRLPKAAADRLVLLDPAERHAPPTLNILQGPDPDLAVEHLVGILQRIWAAHWGPRIDDVMRASCLTLLRQPGSTIADIPRLLDDPMFRRPYLAGLRDPVGLGGFWSWYESQSPASQAQIIGPIMTRLRAFLLRDFVRDVVTSATSSFDLDQILDGGICVARLPKGVLGDETSRLLGSFLVAKVWQAATARAGRTQAGRAAATLYVDECQNFLNLPYRFEELLPEARGYGLSLVLAHQHLGQLGRELYEALNANARTKIFFSLSPTDARLLEAHTLPELAAHDLANLGAYQAAVRLLAAGRELPACTIRTRAPALVIPGRAEHARDRARTNYGRPPQVRQAERIHRELALGGSHDTRLDDPARPAPRRTTP